MSKYRIELIEVGRGKVSKVMEVNASLASAEILTEQECRKHLISSDVGLNKTEIEGVYNVSAGFHTVGKVKISEVK